MNDAASGPIAIVTGAGSGIGAGIADHFAQHGVRVLAVDRNADGFGRFAGTAQISTHVCDVTAADAPTSIFGRCREVFGEPDWLINNAGRGNAKAVHDTPDADLDDYLAVNLKSVFRLSREMVSAKSERPRSIVNISSVFGSVGFPGAAPYSAAKAGVIGLTRQMAADYGAKNVRVNAIAPGLIATPATADRMANNPRYRMLTIKSLRAGPGHQRTLRASRCFSARLRRPTSAGRSLRSMAAGPRRASTRDLAEGSNSFANETTATVRGHSERNLASPRQARQGPPRKR